MVLKCIYENRWLTSVSSACGKRRWSCETPLLLWSGRIEAGSGSAAPAGGSRLDLNSASWCLGPVASSLSSGWSCALAPLPVRDAAEPSPPPPNSYRHHQSSPPPLSLGLLPPPPRHPASETTGLREGLCSTCYIIISHKSEDVSSVPCDLHFQHQCYFIITEILL